MLKKNLWIVENETTWIVPEVDYSPRCFSVIVFHALLNLAVAFGLYLIQRSFQSHFVLKFLVS